MSRALRVLAFAALASCGDHHTWVDVTVTSNAQLTLTSLEVDLTNAGMTAQVSVAKGASFTIPPQQTFAIRVDGRTGDLDVKVSAVDGGSTLATAEQHVAIVPGGVAKLSLSLGGNVVLDGGGSDGPPADLAGSCTDGILNGTETGVDCGGSCPNKCADGSGCKVTGDCMSAFCSNAGVCGPSHCVDTIKDSDETDIDCGGAACNACEPDKACVADTDCATSTCITSICALASGPPNWIPVTAPSVKTAYLSGAVGRDGLVYFVDRFDTAAGGFLSAPFNNYDPVANTLNNLSTLPSTRGEIATTFGPDGRFYVIGGEFNANVYNLVDAWANGAWASPAPHAMTSDRSQLAATTGGDGRIYAIAGHVDTSGNPFIAEAYTPSTDTWVQAGQLTQRSYHAAVTDATGKVYALGGVGALTSMETWNGDGVSFWKALATMPTGRARLQAVTGADGRIYAIGGDDNGSPATVLTSVDVYSPPSNTWFTAPALNTARSIFVGGQLPDGRMIVVLGTNAAGPVGQAEFYGPTVKLSTSTAAAGSTVTVSGANFAKNANVSVRFDGTNVGSGTTDASGALTAPISFTVPNATSGAHTVIAMDANSRYPITLPFQIP